MKITIEATQEYITLADGKASPVWAGVTSGGLRVFAVLSTLGCLPEDETAFAREVEAEGGKLSFNGNVTLHAAGIGKLN